MLFQLNFKLSENGAIEKFNYEHFTIKLRLPLIFNK